MLNTPLYLQEDGFQLAVEGKLAVKWEPVIQGHMIMRLQLSLEES